MQHLDQTFAALGDSTRRAILSQVALGETSLSELAKPFAMSQTAISKHVRVLSNAGLVKIQKRGRTRYCQINAQPMQEAASWIETYQKFWTKTLDDLNNHMESKK